MNTQRRRPGRNTHVDTADEQGGQRHGIESPGLYAGVALQPGVLKPQWRVELVSRATLELYSSSRGTNVNQSACARGGG